MLLDSELSLESEATHWEGGSRLFLSSTSPADRPGHHNTARFGIYNIQAGLLLLGVGRDAAVNNRASAARAERCGASNFRPWAAGSYHTEPSAV